MDRNPKRRWSSAAWLFAALLGVPALADAQLIPNLPLRKREKPPCEAEPPYYKTVRHQYYGYFPTCWRTFPAGWGCPCPKPALGDYSPTKPSNAGVEPPPENPINIQPTNPKSPDMTPPPLPPESDLFKVPDPNPPQTGPTTPPAALPAPPATGPSPPPPSASLPGADPFSELVADAPSSRPSPALLDPGSPSSPLPMSPVFETAPEPAPAVAAPAAPRRGLLSGLFSRFRR